MPFRPLPFRLPVLPRLPRVRRSLLVDAALVLLIAAGVFALYKVAGQVSAPQRASVEIDLSPKALPLYALFSVSRGFAAYILSFLFTIIYGYAAAKSVRAERVMVLLLDVLQSIPVLGFMPGLVLALVAIFPRTNLGLELAAVLMIFTGQVWNMTFSFYHSLRSIPEDLRHAAEIYGLNWWKRLWRLELPYSAMGLVWNSMMSVAGGWFFLMICEGFILGDRDFRLPGIGSYMSVAIEKKNIPAMIWGISAMILIILLIDQLIWRPIIAWAQKFKYEETEALEVPGSRLLELLRGSSLLGAVSGIFSRLRYARQRTRLLRGPRLPSTQAALKAGGRLTGLFIFLGIVAAAMYGVVGLVRLLSGVSPDRWFHIGHFAGLTLLRTTAAVALGSLWAIPLGVAIGTKPRLARFLQPIVQIGVSFPAPMIFPLVVLLLFKIGGNLEWGSIILMTIGVQWYILFNAVAGAMAIPNDLKDVCSAYQVSGWLKWRRLILPAIFPALVTGWITSAGGAWNASIVTEYVSIGGRAYMAHGLGALISDAAKDGNFAELAAGVVVMAFLVVTVNRLFWKRLYRIAEERFSLG